MKIDRAKLRDNLKKGAAGILQGKFLQRLRAQKFLPHIAYVFFLFAVVIFLTLLIDGTLTKVEKNKETIRRMSVENTQKEYELTMLNRQSTVLELLEREGSQVQESEKPATRLK